ncbi:hypothetical protein [Glutamicibacter protophormiae]
MDDTEIRQSFHPESTAAPVVTHPAGLGITHALPQRYCHGEWRQ